MATHQNQDKLTWEYENCFIPKYVPQNLKWFERNGLEAWYRQNKCQEFWNNTDLHFAKRKVINFDIIKNEVSDNDLKQYQLIYEKEIKNYPLEFQNQIRSSIFRSADRKDMNISKETIKENFNKPITSKGLSKKDTDVCTPKNGNKKKLYFLLPCNSKIVWYFFSRRIFLFL